MFAIADPCAPSLLLTDSCERLERLDSVSVLGASTGVSSRHERLSRHAGFDRWQHALDSLVRVEPCRGCETTARLEELNTPRRLISVRDMPRHPFIRSLCNFADVLFYCSFRNKPYSPPDTSPQFPGVAATYEYNLDSHDALSVTLARRRRSSTASVKP